MEKGKKTMAKIKETADSCRNCAHISGEYCWAFERPLNEIRDGQDPEECADNCGRYKRE